MKQRLGNVFMSVGLALGLGLAFWFQFGQRPVAAEGPAAPEPASTAAAPAQDASPRTGISLLETLRAAASGETADPRARVALRQACEQVLADGTLDANSPAHRLARRELLSFRLEELALLVEPEPALRDWSLDCLKLFKESARTAADVELAVDLSTRFEEIASPDEARGLYEKLGDLFIRSSDPVIARRGDFLLGAARRLGIQGQVLEIAGRTLDDQEFTLQSLRGKFVLVNFWATWCVHSQDEIPVWQKCGQQFGGSGLEIVNVCLDDEASVVNDFLKRNALPGIHLHDDEAGSDHPAAIRYGITAYPTSFLLDRQGHVVAVDLRGKGLVRRLAELCSSSRAQRRPYPVFRLDDVLDKLTRTATALQQAGKSHGDAEFRGQLDRKFVELDLPEVSEETVADRTLYQRGCESVFVVCSLYRVDQSWETSLASAFAVTRDGVLATSCHVFDNPQAADVVVVMNVHGKVFPVLEVLAADRQGDTCLFRIDAADLEPLPLGTDSPPGTRVRVMGHPGDSFYFLSTGVISNYERDSEGTTWLNTTADFGQGSSGGPVLDDFGNVVGQVSRTYTLYAGGPARGRGRRVRTATQVPLADAAENRDPGDLLMDIADPQMVFKACTPVHSLRALIRPRKVAAKE